ncbi:MAG: glycoside hydrolase family 127 protein [Oscillospiraceae bacterium]|nr:glycoside hydrolase family 127 protein [Oscillospiraceae bacterium]
MKPNKLIAAISALSITVSVFTAVPVYAATAVSNETGLVSAISNGGDYELTADISAANAGINTTPSTGILNGNGHTLTKSNSKWGDAILYQNCNGNWTFSDMTIDGNKSTGTFTDAALWYMAGTIKFDNVKIQNFKTSTASRYAMNCNNTANMTLNNVTFAGNENAAATMAEPDVYIDGGTLHLSGNTSANVYYAGGSIDISGLSGDCDITITASDADKYKSLIALTPPASVKMTADAGSRTIGLSSSGIEWAISGERSKSDNGKTTVYVSVSNFTDTDKEVTVEAAAYDESGAYVSGTSDTLVAAANAVTKTELTLETSDNDTIKVNLKDGTIQLTEELTVTKIRDESLSLFYDFENPADTESLIYGGASVESGKGISGNGLRFDGVNGYMQLPNGIMTDNMTIMAWIKTDEIKNWARMFDFGTDTANNFFYSPSGGRVESVVNGAADTMNVTAFANTGIWEHYAVTRTANHVQLYRNGELVSEADCKNSVTGITETTNYIGRSHWASDAYFCGSMDEIKIYNKICTADEIKKTYDEYAIKLGADAAYKDYTALDFGTTELTDGTRLPAKGGNGSDISWMCSDSSIINADMTINAPEAGEADKRVTLTATVKNGNTVYTKSFNVTILAAPSITGLSDYSMPEVEMKDEYLINGTEKMADYLKDFDIDKLASGFRRTAGLSSTSATYGGWETSLIAGHAVGHYMTAVAQGYNNTGDEDLLKMSNDLIDALYEAQIKEDTTINGQAVKKGYLFATTNAWSGGQVVSGEGQFDNVEANRTNITTQAWVPWYTMHKILAGLIDTYKLTGNEKALEMADLLGTWVYNRVGGYNSSMQTRVLNIEYGGMNDALYELYKITGDPNHAKAAHIFDEISLFDSIYNGEDVLANKHANTTIPKIIGALNRVRTIDATNGQLEKDAPDDVHNREYYLTVAENFWDMVVNDHSYIIGGNSENEHFRAPHTENAYRNNVNCETCNTYNMLKLSRELYKLTGDKKYKDYYESTFLNAIISSQNPETGMTMYFQPMASGYFKVYSSRWNDFWCCTGSGMENFTKLTDSIYYKKDNAIVVNQYISSVLTDKENGIKLTQDSELPDGETSKFTVELLDTFLTESTKDGWELKAEKTIYNGSLSAIGKVTNNSGKDGSVSVYAAVYESNGELNSVKKIDLTIENSQSESFWLKPRTRLDDEIKVFLWDGMEPITDVVTVNGKQEQFRNAEIVLRIPEWSASAPEIKVNGEKIEYTQSAGYASIERYWQTGDTIEITMPMEMRAYGLPDSDTVTAFKYGPTVLSVGIPSTDFAEEGHGMAVRKPKNKANINEYVIIDSSYGTREEWLANLNENMAKTDGKLEFTMQNTDQALVFTPHYKRHDERYGIYWYVSGMTEEEQQAQILADKQAGRDANIIIDSIEPSHDQQENGHGYTQDNSTGVEGTGTMPNYREIANGGYVDYQMAVKKGVKNYLAVTYHSSDAGKKMSIYAGDTKIADVTTSGNSETIRYEIPDDVVNAAAPSTADTIKGKDALHIIFRADAGTDAPKLCGTVEIVTDYGTNPSLVDLTFDTGTLSPAFDSDVTEYTLTIQEDIESVSIKATLAEQYGLVYVNNILINDAVSKNVTVSETPIVITTYAEDHATSKTYTITFVK